MLNPAGVILMTSFDALTAVAVIEMLEYTVIVTEPAALVGVVIWVPRYVADNWMVVVSTMVNTKYVVPATNGPHVDAKTTGICSAIPVVEVDGFTVMLPEPVLYAVAIMSNVPTTPDRSGKTPEAVTATVPGHMNPEVPVVKDPRMPQ
jgi:hypothetical protein